MLLYNSAVRIHKWVTRVIGAMLFCMASWGLASTLGDKGLGMADFTAWNAADRVAYHGSYTYKLNNVRCVINLQIDQNPIAATYQVTPQGQPQDKYSVPLSGIVIDGNRFHCAPVVIKSAFPYFLPPAFEGQFVQRNKDEKGLLIGDIFFKHMSDLDFWKSWLGSVFILKRDSWLGAPSEPEVVRPRARTPLWVFSDRRDGPLGSNFGEPLPSDAKSGMILMPAGTRVQLIHFPTLPDTSLLRVSAVFLCQPKGRKSPLIFSADLERSDDGQVLVPTAGTLAASAQQELTPAKKWNREWSQAFEKYRASVPSNPTSHFFVPDQPV